MEFNKIYNEDCLSFIPKLDDSSIDTVVTSPPYNTSKKSSQNEIERKRKEGKLEKGFRQHHSRYDVFQDQQTDDEYADFIASIFNALEPKMKPNGTIVWNVSYGIGDTGKPNYAVWYSLLAIMNKTPFTLVEYYPWKKPVTTTLNTKNDLTRICEIVWVFARKTEISTYHVNKEKVKGWYISQPAENWVQTKLCNDEVCDFNAATYPSEFVEKSLALYGTPKGLVYDPFMGTGTTAIGAISCGMNYIGTELSPNQCKWAEKRIRTFKGNSLWFR